MQISIYFILQFLWLYDLVGEQDKYHTKQKFKTT